MAIAKLNDMAINYRQVGQGNDVVLIHGLAANHAFWHFDVLMPLARDHRVTVYDLRGHGYSEMPSSGYTSGDMAADLLALLDHLDIAQAHLVGHSVGGVVALHFTALHQKRVSSVTVADARIRAFQSSHRPVDWPNWSIAKKKLEEIGIHLDEQDTESGIRILEQLALLNGGRNREKLKGTSLSIPFSRWGGGNHSASRWLELLNTTTARADFAATQLSAEKVAGIKVPLQAIYGGNSPMLPSMQGLQECLPHCECVTIPEAGHFFPLGKSARFTELILDFLGRCEAQVTSTEARR